MSKSNSSAPAVGWLSQLFIAATLDLTPLRVSRDYRMLFIGQFVSTFGYALTYVVLPWQVSWVEEIMVAEDVRRAGVGRKLMESFEQWARSRQSKLIALATRRAAAFYKGLGYEESATYFRRLL